ncbi:YtcA family lipoprotein [Rhizosaccharibacter radicis]|uniref:Uncharacterized protein YtcA n=1 Tax=Rhizosaccharibacter radicis TaxID=2782605 RepID=A0ABT1VZE0_9PROT|nr:YtcA family lipoprotein [Acetobacteraceae bacterium KSS12]
MHPRLQLDAAIAPHPFRNPSRIATVLFPLMLPGCTGAPAMNVVGSFFPAWMLCALIGIASAVVLRQVLMLCGLESYVVAPLLTHGAVALAVTLSVWLLFFGH